MTCGPGLQYSVDGPTATLTLDRPHAKNAFTLDTIDAWVDALQRAAADDAVRVIVLTGAGDAFCAGMDLGALSQADAAPLARKRLLTDHIHQVGRTLEQIDKPTIAAINGVAVGAGLDMALLCDMRVAARSARMSEGYIRAGLVPGDGGAWLLPRLVGPAKAMELLLTGAFVSADEAASLGLVNRAVDDADLMTVTYGLASEIAAAPPVQVAMIKRLVRQAEHLDLQTHFDLVSSHMAIVATLDDSAEALAALREKRPGRYIGR
jgi:enoyl-CoA hydratase/carnithine racemase